MSIFLFGVIQTNALGTLGVNGKIAYVAFGSGNNSIFAMNSDGTNQTRLITPNGTKLSVDAPDWSPDGKHIVFRGDLTGQEDSLYVMNSDGTNVTSLHMQGDFPKWSPDGTRITFFTQGYTNIYVVNPDGSHPIRITNTSDVYAPDWSPDSSKIVFLKHVDNTESIFVMNADGTNQTRITNDPNGDEEPTFSPDGKKIAYFRNNQIYVVNSDGTNPTGLTLDFANDGFPSWSPDGTQIAYMSTRSGSAQIYVMNSDGSGQTQLTKGPMEASEPSWGALKNDGAFKGLVSPLNTSKLPQFPWFIGVIAAILVSFELLRRRRSKRRISG